MRNLTLAILSLVLFSGCAARQQYAWNKPGATQEEFAQDKYACVREARAPSSSAYMSGGYYAGNTYVPGSGAASSGEIVNEAFFKPCMEAKGYTVTTAQSSTAQPSPAVQEVRTKMQALGSEAAACTNAIRSKPQYAALVSHLSEVTSGTFSMAQLTDKSVATSGEAQAMVAYSDEVNSSCGNKSRAAAAAVVPALGPIFDRTKTAIDSVVILVVERKITWGEYAQRIKQIRSEYVSQLNQIRI
jgi:hypothetical protein